MSYAKNFDFQKNSQHSLATMSDWIQTLPFELRTEIQIAVSKSPEALDVFSKLYNYLTEQDLKRRRVEISQQQQPLGQLQQREAQPQGIHEAQPVQPKQEAHITQAPQPAQVPSDPPTLHPTLQTGTITLTSPINPETIIFEIPQVSFQSPIRKKLNLTFHLIEDNNQPIPVLSIINPTKQVPELSLVNLRNSIKLCTIIPILGNSTNSVKKSIVSLCFWINDDMVDDKAYKDPIICQINLDIIKKQMVKDGKLPPDVENKLQADAQIDNLSLTPIHERIIDYFQRQFKLCGINLINYLPCSSLFKNQFTLNTDSAIALSTNNIKTFLLVEAHKGSKDGSLMFLSSNVFNKSFIIFGFKKPILIFDMPNIVNVSYSNITRLTFSMLLTLLNDQKEEKVLEFSMIDQQYFTVIDEFMKLQNINDNSYDDNLREKVKGEDVKVNGTNTEGNGANDGVTLADINASEDEDDGDYGEVNDEEDGSDVDEEFDSEAASDEEEGEEEDDGVFNKNKEEEDIE